MSELSPIRRKQWTAGRARIACRSLKGVVEPQGWALCVRGSLITAERGNDLDLVALPVYANALEVEALLWLIYQELGWRPLLVHQHTLAGVLGVLYETEQARGYRVGRIVDMNFWRRPTDPPARSLAELELEHGIAAGWGDGC